MYELQLDKDLSRVRANEEALKHDPHGWEFFHKPERDTSDLPAYDPTAASWDVVMNGESFENTKEISKSPEGLARETEEPPVRMDL